MRGTAMGIKAMLRHKGKRRHRAGGPEERRGKIPGTRSIEDRPAEAGARERLGDWQRGTNENTNGLLREYFPKGTNFSEVTDEEVREVYDEINKRPRKCLGYLTPYEVHYSKTLQLLWEFEP